MAGDVLRSLTRYKALDETGVFGCACRHEFPAHFFDLKHGEWHVEMLICTPAIKCNVEKLGGVWDRVSGRHGTRSGPQPYLSYEEEEELVTYLIKCAEIGQD